jgi:hypothetical protein
MMLLLNVIFLIIASRICIRNVGQLISTEFDTGQKSIFYYCFAYFSYTL